ncbi:MAG: RidA family protein [Pseudanabaenaceae cyanobacterium bins.68]|nr:RidA family protein [Pseudanabaenaceae cyanobacterium bins.68]
MATIIRSDQAPAPVGPYNQAIALEPGARLIFLAGQVPLDPATGQLVRGTIAEETEQVLKNIGAVLAAAGAEFSQVVKTTVFLSNMADFAAMNQVYAQYFSAPARSCVQVAALPLGARVEIECIAAL